MRNGRAERDRDDDGERGDRPRHAALRSRRAAVAFAGDEQRNATFAALQARDSQIRGRGKRERRRGDIGGRTIARGVRDGPSVVLRSRFVRRILRALARPAEHPHRRRDARHRRERRCHAGRDGDIARERPSLRERLGKLGLA